MRLLVACAFLLCRVGTSLAQAPPETKSVAPLTQSQNEMREAAALQIELLNKQLAVLSQIASQNQRGLVVYPIAFALPGPINCQGNCRGTVAEICRAVRYPNSYAYPAVVTSDVIGAYTNGVCYGP